MSIREEVETITDIVIAGFERAEEAFRTIEALLKANDDIRIIMVHDGSIDKPDLSSLDTARIIELHLERCGQAKCVNAGLEIVKSEYVAVMHADTIINDKNWVRKAVNFLRANKEAGLISTIGVQFEWVDLQRFYCQFITSLKNRRGRFKMYVDIGMDKDFMEVWRTDNVVNIFKVGIKADERYGICGVSFWIDVKAKGLKCYVMRFDDAEHLRTRSFDLEAYKELVPNFKEEQKHVSKVTAMRMKAFGITFPKGIDITEAKIKQFAKGVK